MRRFSAQGVMRLAPLFVLGVSACSVVVGLGDLEFKGNATGSSGGGAPATGSSSSEGVGPGGAGGSKASAGSTATGGEPGTLYVNAASTAGTPDGSIGAPFQTVGAAITLATQDTSFKDIDICNGIYRESLTLNAAVSLHGGFDCTTWVPDGAFPSNTILTAEVDGTGPPVATLPTLAVTGGVVSSNVVIENLKITSGAEAQSGSSSLVVSFAQMAAPDFKHNYVVAGSGHATDLASVGVQVSNNAHPIIEDNYIDGGSGVITPSNNAGTASVALLLAGPVGNPIIRNNTLFGGSGDASAQLASTGSRGLFVKGGAPTTANGAAITGNHIDGGKGTANGNTNGHRSIAVANESNAPMDLIGNVINGGSGSQTGGSIGVRVRTSGTTVSKNLIYGGDNDSGDTGAVIGVAVAGQNAPVTNSEIVNNMIYGGNRANNPLVGVTSVIGISVDYTDGLKIYSNTVFGGGAGTNPSHSASALTMATQNANAEIVDNLFFAVGSDYDLIFDECEDANGAALFNDFDNNTFFGGMVLARQILSGAMPAGSCTTMNLTTIDALAADLNGFAAGNQRVAGSCIGTACIALSDCTNDAACPAVFFSNWSTTDLGYGPVSSTGWTLVDPCPNHALLGGKNVAVALDFFGNNRDTTPTIGAEEQPTTCF